MKRDILLDEKIEKIFKEKIKKSDKYNIVIQRALFDEKITNKNNLAILKRVACVIFLCILATGIIFTKDISAFIGKHLLNINSNEGIRAAIENDYIHETNMEPSSYNDVSIKIDEIIMDKFNLLILFDIETPKVEKIQNIKIENLIITDEKDNYIVLKLESSDEYKEFYEEQNIKQNYKNIALNNGAYYEQLVIKQNKNLKFKYTTHSEEFPKSKILNVKIKNLIFEFEKGNNEKILGEWNFSIDLPEKMYNRKVKLYNETDENTEDISIVKAEVSNTETRIELTTKWGEPVYTDEDSEEEKRRKIDEVFNKNHSIKEILIKDEYIENSNGERFYPVINSNDDNGGYNQMLDGTLRYWQTFNLTEYNATDTLKLVLNKQGKIIEINLKNKK